MDVSQAEPSAQLLNDNLAVVKVMIADGRHAEAPADAEALANLDLARVPAMARLGFAATRHAHAPPASRIVYKPPQLRAHRAHRASVSRARILHMKREPRDVVSSNHCVDYAVKFGGTAFADDSSWIGERLVGRQRLMNHWHSVFPGDILDVGDDALGGARRAGAGASLTPSNCPGRTACSPSRGSSVP